MWKLPRYTLLATVGKILSRVLLNRLNDHISQNVLPETQCGFRCGRSTVNMIFCLKQVQEKCSEQNIPIYVVFMDSGKALDTVLRQGLWQVLKKYDCTEKFVSLMRHSMQSNVTTSGSASKDFSTAMLEVAFNYTSEGVYIQTRQKQTCSVWHSLKPRVILQ